MPDALPIHSRYPAPCRRVILRHAFHLHGVRLPRVIRIVHIEGQPHTLVNLDDKQGGGVTCLFENAFH